MFEDIYNANATKTDFWILNIFHLIKTDKDKKKSAIFMNKDLFLSKGGIHKSC